MKILHISTYDKGGAATACIRLHEGLLNAGIDSKVLVLNKTKENIPEVYEYFYNKKSFFYRLKNKIHQTLNKFNLYNKFFDISKYEQYKLQNIRPEGLIMISFPMSNFNITNNSYFKEADIIHLHWVANFLDYKTFFNKCQKPIIWTFHDQNPFLGLEHCPEKYLNPNKQGIPIPRQFSNYEIEIENKYKQIKYEIFKNKSLNIIALCNWIKNEINNSKMFPLANINLIPNGIDSKQFIILNKTFCRELLGLPLKKKIILFVADYNCILKGFNYLLNAIEKIKDENILVCSIGNDDVVQYANKCYCELGKFNDYRLMNIAYSAADVFLIPSLIDNLPNTVIESLLSGTPVISFPIGGMIDMIKHKKNGYLTDELNTNSLSDSIKHFFNEGIEWNYDEIRKDAIERYDISVQVKNIIQLYNSIIN